MRKPTRTLLGVLIACVSLSACATFHLPTAHLERTRVTPTGLRVGAAFGREASTYTQFNADGGGAVPRSERHARVLRYGGTFGTTLSAPMLPVNCIASTSTPCTTSGNPGNGSEGDPAWLAFGKLNAWGTQLGLFTNDAANEVLATPDGAAGIPYLRPLVGDDIPAISLAAGNVNGGVVGILPAANGGTGLSTLIANDCIAANSAATAYEFVSCGSGTSGISSLTGDGSLITNSASTGAVTLTLGSAPAYGVWGNDTSASGAPAYTALSSWPVAAFPTLNQSTTGNAATATTATEWGGQALPSLVSGDCLSNNGTAMSWATCSSAFNDIASGTNTTAAMTVGSGASLTYSGTGSVNASEVAGVIKAVNSAAAGNTLTPNCDYAMVKIAASTYLIQAPLQSAPTTASTGGSLAGNVYYYVVTSTTAAGETTPSTQTSIASDTAVAPTAGTPTTAITGGTLSSGTYYYVVTATTAAGQTTASTQETAADTATVAAPTAGTASTATTGGTGLAASTTYYMVVTATTPNGQSTISAVESVATGTGTTNTVTANWSASTGATGYNVYISTATITAGEATVAYSTAASSATSLTFTAVPTTTATTPSSNTATANTNANTINWTAVTGASGYVVYRSTTSGDFTSATSYSVSGGSTTSYTDTGATGTTATPPTTNTAYLTATNENVISWAAVTGADGYTVYRSTTSGDFTNATSYSVSGGSTVSFTDTGATGTTATPPTTNTSGQFNIENPGTCTPVDGQQLEIKVTSPTGGLLTYAWGSGYQASGQLAFPTTSYAAGDEDFFTVQYDADLSKWDLLAVNQGF